MWVFVTCVSLSPHSPLPVLFTPLQESRPLSWCWLTQVISLSPPCLNIPVLLGTEHSRQKRRVDMGTKHSCSSVLPWALANLFLSLFGCGQLVFSQRCTGVFSKSWRRKVEGREEGRKVSWAVACRRWPGLMAFTFPQHWKSRLCYLTGPFQAVNNKPTQRKSKPESSSLVKKVAPTGYAQT